MESIDIRIKSKKIYDVAKANDYKGAISENQLKQFLAFEEQQLKHVPTAVAPKEGKVIPFPKEKITDWTKPRPTEVTKPTFTATEHV